MQTKTLIAALFAGSALGANVLPRQTDGGSACSSILLSMPTPPAKLIEDLTKNPQTDLCKFSVPASISKDFSSYTSAVSSFYEKNKDKLTKCPGFDQIKSQAPIDCKAGSGDSKTTSGGTSGSKTTAASGSQSTAGSQETSSSKGGAPRETGMVMAAVAAAGFALAAL